MPRVVINTTFGGFSLSKEALVCLEAVGLDEDAMYEMDVRLFRMDARLVAVVEDLGERADGSGGPLKIVDVPDDCDWEIKCFDGSEFVVDRARVWR